MTDGDALFAAILANPDEDTPRLAYADWLDENGDSVRAEFIRVQVEHANAPTPELRGQEAVLLATHGAEWLAPLQEKGGPLGHPGTHGQFRRGFVEVVWMPATWFLQRGESLFTRAPVRELRVTETTPDQFAQLVYSAPLARLDGLDLSDRRLGDLVVHWLARSVGARGLTRLRLRGCGITDEGVRLLASTHFDRPLRELDVSHNPITPAGLDGLRRRYGDAVRAEGFARTA